MLTHKETFVLIFVATLAMMFAALFLAVTQDSTSIYAWSYGMALFAVTLLYKMIIIHFELE